MPLDERLFNIGCSLSVLFWGLMGLIAESAPIFASPVRIAISALNFTIGILLFSRNRLDRQGSLTDMLISLPSLLIAGFAFRLAPPTHIWPIYAEIVFVLGALLAIVTFFYLGKNFAVLPAVREVVVSGPYRFVRHPAYLGEFLMVMACFIARPTWITVWPFVCVVPFVCWRISVEENLWRDDAGFQNYSAQVVYRLFPGIW